MNNIITHQESKFEELAESYKKLMNSLTELEGSSVIGRRLLAINSKMEDLKEEIDHLQYECDRGVEAVEDNIECKERMIEYEKSRIFMDKMFPFLYVLFEEMRRVDQA